MQIIQFKENQKEVWNKFIAENSSESFLQAWEWGSFQESLGRKIWRMGIVKSQKSKVKSLEISNSSLLGMILIVKYDLPFGQSYLYCPRGPVAKASSIKYQASSIFNFLSDEIKKIAKEEKAMFLKIDPPAELDREIEAPPLKKGTGGIFKKSSSEIQPRDTLILDLTKSEEELLKEMKPKTRYNIRLAERKGVKVINPKSQIPNPKYFNEFWRLINETSERDKFASHNKDYYWKMLKSLNFFQDGKQDSKQKLQAKLYLAEYENKTIAANIVLSFGDFCVYLHGASSSKYRNVMAPYLLQWMQILGAKKTGCKSYDFWGIDSSKFQIPNPKSQINSKFNDWSGITRFKKGFGGQERNYVGAYDLVFNWEKYYMYKFFRRIKTTLKLIKHSV